MIVLKLKYVYRQKDIIFHWCLMEPTGVCLSRPVALFYKYCQIIFAHKLSIAARSILLEYWSVFLLNSLSEMQSHMCFIIACSFLIPAGINQY